LISIELNRSCSEESSFSVRDEFGKNRYSSTNSTRQIDATKFYFTQVKRQTR